ncbi:zinc finger CCHC domain-containing protein 8 isoform X3 [Ambystoma mexicanum]|uniref:zinc finger CCHC domain-containing protein 8 isoform X3 n=1 Tax=Ambystoma mexicanum TaxID=8296 RepID=UPI0037E802FB
MAEVDFGDSELFEQLEEEQTPPVHIRFTDKDNSSVEAEELREQVRRCEDTIEELKAENQELRRKLNILTRPSGLCMTDSQLDGPLLQILFMNSVLSKQYHTDIEDFVADLVNKYLQHETSKQEQTSFNLKPQPSSILLEEDNTDKAATTMKKIKDAFSVVGSVLYFASFCLDKLGQPLLNENPQLTEGWDVPTYHQVFTQIVSLEGQELPQGKAKRPKAHCFNCGGEDHQLKDCPKPRDGASISAKRKAFMDACGEAGNQNHQQRYHAEEVEERFARFKPGMIGDELQEALGVSENHLPPFIYRMRQLGYPPGWLKEAELETSGLSLYDGKVDVSDGEIEDGETPQKPIGVSYDLSRLVNYPGFNTSVPRGCVDDYRMFGSIPMQSFHQKDVFANYLASTFPVQSPSSNKRTSASQSSPSEIKKQKTSDRIPSPVDMDIDSGRNTLANIADGRASTEEMSTVDLQGPDVCIQVSKTELPRNSPKIEDFLHSIMDEESTSIPDSTLTENVATTITCVENGQTGEPAETDCNVESANIYVPDMSKFAVGITPFEYDNMAESTGLYLRLREVLKNSPRNQQKRSMH